MALAIFVIDFLITSLLLTITDRVEIVLIHFFNVIVFWIFVDRHHNLTVDVIIRIRIWQDDFKLRIVSDVEFKLGCDIRVVEDSQGQNFLVAKCYSSEIYIWLFNLYIWDDCLGSHWQAQLLASSNIYDDL